MKIKSVKSGGGYSMGITKSGKASWKTEPKSKAVSVEATAQLGAATAFKKPDIYSGPGYSTKPMPATGIANARQGHAGAGPGGGNRTIYKSGSQSPTPEAKPLPAGRPILSEYGPEISGPSRRK